MLRLLAQSGAADYVQGGVAGAVLAFATGIVKLLVNREDRAVARGDRLEGVIIDKMLPALTENTSAVTQMNQAMNQLKRERDEAILRAQARGQA